MRVIVFGATGATGSEAVRSLRAAGHVVTAFTRRPDPTEIPADVPRVVGDVLDPAAVERAVAGHDAVVVALGIKENPLRVRLRGAAGTATAVRSKGTAHIVAAMQTHGVRRLVVLSTFGVGATRRRLSLGWRLLFWLLLRPQIADTEVQEAIVRQSGLDWTIARPVSLVDTNDRDDTDDTHDILASPDGEARSMRVPRRAVARFLADAATSTTWLERSVALSA